MGPSDAVTEGSRPDEVVPEPTRRTVLRAVAGVAALGSISGLAACRARPAPPPPVVTPPVNRSKLSSDLELLAVALSVEHQAIAAYTAGIPLLSGAFARAAREFLAAEVSHATEIATLITKGGGKPAPPPPTGYAFGTPRNERDVLALLHHVEQLSIGTYLSAVPALTPGDVRASVASILADEAQHISIIRAVTGKAPVPGPLVTASL
jgi:rubrerythrin